MGVQVDLRTGRELGIVRIYSYKNEAQTYLLTPYSFDRLLDFLEPLQLRKLHDPPPFEGVPLR